ncbi:MULTISPECIES: hypothetical protein [unclassified Leptolyngbya]|uniref:hypothetical protein n=1 Tax=unclassified Leptolyngbya TaxID=2650499 RepID=UPI001687A4BB|nr:MULTISPECIES: hypothetical protein [unclassified Leptolyngbya]MBD1913833.1 hypothetical protein [Leptolyngbya sp. FACHB-8]MBD2157343.1 hypothetical protein [Leptolyngbya sp. FACHB-16]
MVRRGLPVARWPQASALLLSLTLLVGGVAEAPEAFANPNLTTSSPPAIGDTSHIPPQMLVNRVLRTASRDIGLARRNLQIQRFSRETWTDGCLGLGGPAELCLAATVEGWQMEVTNGERSWFYRTDASGQTIRRVERPDVLPPSVRDRLLAEAARQLNVPVSELGVLSSEPRTWDGCMGIVISAAQVCQDMGILGWRAQVQRGEATATAPTWVFHLNSDGTDVRLNPRPEDPSTRAIPTKMNSAELQVWLDTQDRRNINTGAVQERIPTEALVTWLREHWQQGSDPAEVQAALQAADWQSGPEDFQVMDLNGDGRDEWLLTIRLDPNPLPWGRSGDFWIIGDSDRLLHRFFEPEDYFRASSEENPIPLSREFSLSAPQIVALQDYTGDGAPEILLQRQMCGAHTCTQSYTVLSYRDGAIHSLISQAPSLETEGLSVVMPASEVRPSRDENGDGRPDLVLHGGVISSAGAGLQRPRMEVWSWNGTGMTHYDTYWDYSDYRFHLLYEANYRMAQGGRERASALYRQVIDDESLRNDLWWNTSGSVYDSSRQFAAFRLMMMGMMAGDRHEVDTWQGWLWLTYPDAPITEAARQAAELWNNGSSLEAACTAAHDYLTPLDKPEDDPVASDGPTGPLRYMGYGNPELKGSDVCPLDLVRGTTP